jgi:hypothetical protein
MVRRIDRLKYGWYVYSIESVVPDPRFPYSWEWVNQSLLGKANFKETQKARGIMRLLREKGWLDQQKEIYKYMEYGPTAAVIIHRKTLQPVMALVQNLENGYESETPTRSRRSY